MFLNPESVEETHGKTLDRTLFLNKILHYTLVQHPLQIKYNISIFMQPIIINGGVSKAEFYCVYALSDVLQYFYFVFQN